MAHVRPVGGINGPEVCERRIGDGNISLLFTKICTFVTATRVGRLTVMGTVPYPGYWLPDTGSEDGEGANDERGTDRGVGQSRSGVGHHVKLVIASARPDRVHVKLKGGRFAVATKTPSIKSMLNV